LAPRAIQFSDGGVIRELKPHAEHWALANDFRTGKGRVATDRLDPDFELLVPGIWLGKAEPGFRIRRPSIGVILGRMKG
jgi:hypothetical protein